jgi:hypothetical protein
MSMGILGFYLPDANFQQVAAHHLPTHFQDKSEQIWQSTRDWQSRLAPNRPHHSFSVNLMLRYFEWSVSLYRAVQEHGMSQAEAGEFVETIMSEIYQPVPAAIFKLSRLRSGKRETRVKWIMGMITKYFFTSPFHHRHLPWKTGVAFDVTICPLADYFKEQGLPELTVHAACNMDYCLARELGVDLVRSQTIADGAEFCDFRWEFSPQVERSERTIQS